MSLTINELISKLQDVRAKFGNLEVVNNIEIESGTPNLQVITTVEGEEYNTKLVSKLVLS